MLQLNWQWSDTTTIRATSASKPNTLSLSLSHCECVRIVAFGIFVQSSSGDRNCVSHANKKCGINLMRFLFRSEKMGHKLDARHTKHHVRHLQTHKTREMPTANIVRTAHMHLP